MTCCGFCDVAQHPLVVRNQQHAELGADQLVDAGRDRLQGVDVQARVSLVQDRDLGLKDGQLQHLVLLLLATGEPLVHVSLHHGVLDAEHLHLGLHVLAERERVDLLALHGPVGRP